MKRDEKLVMSILEMLEDSDATAVDHHKIEQALAADDEKQANIVKHHIQIMEDNGYVSISKAGRVRLTWAGHDAVAKSIKKAVKRMEALGS